MDWRLSKLKGIKSRGELNRQDLAQCREGESLLAVGSNCLWLWLAGWIPWSTWFTFIVLQNLIAVIHTIIPYYWYPLLDSNMSKYWCLLYNFLNTVWGYTGCHLILMAWAKERGRGSFSFYLTRSFHQIELLFPPLFDGVDSSKVWILLAS